MRVLTCLTAALLGTAVAFGQPPAASAEGDQSWQTCISLTTPPDEKVAACGAVIDAQPENRIRLATAYCFRGHGLTEKRQLDAALSDLNESIKLDPTSACALTNRGRVYGFKGDLDRAMADYDEAIRLDPTFALAYNNRGDTWRNKGDLVAPLRISAPPSSAIHRSRSPMAIGVMPITASATWRGRSPTTQRRSS